MIGGPPRDGIPGDPEVAWPRALSPLSRVQQEGGPDPGVPVTPEVAVEWRLVDVGADDDIGPVAGHGVGDGTVAPGATTDDRPVWWFVMQHQPWQGFIGSQRCSPRKEVLDGFLG